MASGALAPGDSVISTPMLPPVLRLSLLNREEPRGSKLAQLWRTATRGAEPLGKTLQDETSFQFSINPINLSVRESFINRRTTRAKATGDEQRGVSTLAPQQSIYSHCRSHSRRVLDRLS